MKRLSQNDKGFTLVELMVVVAIIGVLSAVAIPNFKRYQAKSKTSEAKLNLSALYSAETALQADYSSFASCLEYAGFSPNPDYYAVGFHQAFNEQNGYVRNNGGTGCENSDTFQWSASKSVGTEPYEATNLAETEITGSSFVAHAEGFISTDNNSGRSVASIWSIDENKNLEEIQQGY